MCLKSNYRLSGIVLRGCPTRDGFQSLSHQGRSSGAVPPGMVLRSCPTKDDHQGLSHQGGSSGAIPPGKILGGCSTRYGPYVLSQNLQDNPDRNYQLCKFWDSPKEPTLMRQPPRTIPDGTASKNHPWWDSP